MTQGTIKTVERRRKGRKLTMERDCYGDILVRLEMKPSSSKYHYLEAFSFRPTRRAKKLFSAYKDDIVLFDTEKARLFLDKSRNKYRLVFLGEQYQESRVLEARLSASEKSAENESFSEFFDLLAAEKKGEVMKTISDKALPKMKALKTANVIL